MAKVNVELKDGRIVEYNQNQQSYKGCPTCNFGSEYIKELNFIVDVDWSTNQQIVEIKASQMYEYVKELNAENVIRMLNKIIENPIDFDEFFNLCKETFKLENDDVVNKVMTMDVYEKIKRA